MRVALYCQHVLGMGHLFRTLAIVEALSGHDRLLVLGGPRTPAAVPEVVALLRLPVTLDKRLREQHFGQWTGRLWRDVPADALRAAEAAGWGFFPPEGESREEVRLRAMHALTDAARANTGKTVLVVTHQGVIKAVLYHLLGRAYLPEEPRAFDPNRLQRLVCQDGVLSVDALDVDFPEAPQAPAAP